MSTHYTTEPPPTASVLLHTSAGPLTISLFANQTPLTCRNFLQHVLDGYYDNNIFHRVSSGFVIQTGDPTGTGEGGENIYEDPAFERYDDHWARLLGKEKDEKIVFGDELHSRLKFNRRGLLGMAKGTGDGGGYGSQFFITLGDCRSELDGKCTMFGRVEGDGIYNVVKIAEGELVEGTERPVYPEKIIRAEIVERPKGDAWQSMRKRERTSPRVVEEPVKKKGPKKKAGKALLSFGDEPGEDDGGVIVRPKKAKFNPALIDGGATTEEGPTTNGSTSNKNKPPPPTRRKESLSLSSQGAISQVPQKRKATPPPPQPTSPSATHRRTPSFHDPTTQLPLRDPESPSRSPTPVEEPGPDRFKTSTATLQAEIAALKASMRRDIPTATESKHKKSIFESLIPATSTRGRKRPRRGDSHPKDDAKALKMLNAFKSRLESADALSASMTTSTSKSARPRRVSDSHADSETKGDHNEEEEATLCDLHFIANCQSCSKWDESTAWQDRKGEDDDDLNDGRWMSHALSFEKDRLGKDLTWKKKTDEELVVIDPREREREVREKLHSRDKGKGKQREGAR